MRSVQRDNIKFKEIQLWDCLLEWCKFKTELDGSNIEEGNTTDFLKLKECLQPRKILIDERFRGKGLTLSTERGRIHLQYNQGNIFHKHKRHDQARLSFNYSIEQPKRRGSILC